MYYATYCNDYHRVKLSLLNELQKSTCGGQLASCIWILADDCFWMDVTIVHCSVMVMYGYFLQIHTLILLLLGTLKNWNFYRLIVACE